MSNKLHAVAQRFRSAKRSGDGFSALCPAHDDQNPSLSIFVKPSGWIGLKCFAGCDEKVVIAKAGLTNTDLVPTDGHRNSSRTPEEKLAFAAKLWSEAVLAVGTAAERYLRARGITTGFDRVRFHPSVEVTKEDRDRGEQPHAAALFRATNGALQAVFLRGDAKADNLRVPKKAIGPNSKHAVILQEGGEGLLILAEGPETALSVVSAGIQGTVAAVLGTGNFRAVGLRSTASVLLLVGDGDAPDAPSRKTLRATARAIAAAGKIVHVLELPPNGEDMNNIIQRAGPQEVRRLVEQALAVPWVDPEPRVEAVSTETTAHDGEGDSSRALPVIAFRAVDPDLKRPQLIKGWLAPQTVNLLFGGSNLGKSFFSLHLALCVALGVTWFGRKVQQGGVLYVAAESPGSIERRLYAMRRHHKLEGREVPLWVVPQAVDLAHTDSGLMAVVGTIGALPNAISLVIVDTLAGCMSGADENSFEAMSGLVARLLELRNRTGAAVLAVHHSGKDGDRGARGHSSLRAAVDTEIELRQEEQGRIATVTKARDGQTGDRVGFDLQPILLGTDADGEEVRVPVVVPLTADQIRKPPTGNDGKVLAVLTRLTAVSSSGVTEASWRDEFIRTVGGRMKPESARDVFRRALKRLVPTWAVVGGGVARLAVVRQQPDKPETPSRSASDRTDNEPTAHTCRADPPVTGLRGGCDPGVDRQEPDNSGLAPEAGADGSDSGPTTDTCRTGNPRPTTPTHTYGCVGVSGQPADHQRTLEQVRQELISSTTPADSSKRPKPSPAPPAQTDPAGSLAAPPPPPARRTGLV